jgi:hypothetical protein
MSYSDPYAFSRETFHCEVLAKNSAHQPPIVSNRVNRIDRVSSAYSTTPSVMVEKPWNGSLADQDVPSREAADPNMSVLLEPYSPPMSPWRRN